MKHLFFSVGEPSGDLHAAAVIRHLPEFRVSGIGGDAMINSGVRPLFHVRETAIMGFVEVAKNYRRLMRIFDKTCETIRNDRPDLLILVDYPGFNLRLAKYAKSLGIPVLYYIAPKLWAWAAWRINRLRENVDRLAVIFPFEAGYFGSRGIRTDYVGNPNAEIPPTPLSRMEFFKQINIPETARCLGLLPGSRNQEVARILPPLLSTAKALMDQGRFEFTIISKFNNLSSPIFSEAIRDPRFRLSDGSDAILAHSDFLFVKSGTITLEAALHLKPFIVVYKTSPLSTFIGRRLVHLPYVSMANIVLERAVVPEFLHEAVCPERLLPEALSILDNPKRRNEMQQAFTELRTTLSTQNASLNVANIIKEMIHG